MWNILNFGNIFTGNMKSHLKQFYEGIILHKRPKIIDLFLFYYVSLLEGWHTSPQWKVYLIFSVFIVLGEVLSGYSSTYI